MSFPRYPSYKDSGVEWLGKVPEHWDVSSFRHCLSHLFNGLTATQLDEAESTVPVTRIETISAGVIDETRLGFVSVEDAREDRKLLAGDILFSNINSLNMVGNCAFYGGGRTIYAGMNLLVFRPVTRCVPRWLYWLVRSSIFRSVVEALAKPAINQASVSQSSINSILVSKPPLSEQTAIAEFLDRETGKIDELVAEQRRLMELLKEKRQAVISHAVTRGLNPAAPLKPSGIEWLGDVPGHWEVTRVANVFREVAEAGTDDLPILSVSIHHGVSDQEIDEEDMERKVTRSDDRTKYKQVAPGDLVYNMMRAWQGGFGTVTVAGMVSPAYVVARPKRSLETAYVEHLLRTPQAIEQMRRHSRGVTDFRLRLYWDEFKNLAVLVPPQDEAKAICAHIAEMHDLFQNMTTVSEQAIDLLQERRTALISAAVTGQIDVRSLTEKKAA